MKKIAIAVILLTALSFLVLPTAAFAGAPWINGVGDYEGFAWVDGTGDYEGAPWINGVQ